MIEYLWNSYVLELIWLVDSNNDIQLRSIWLVDL